MGLDMYLMKADKGKEKFNWDDMWEVGYWRKANQIHNWFVENVQDGIDDCGIYEAKKEQLENLLDRCKLVLNSSKLVKGKIVNGERYVNGKWEAVYVDGEYIEDPSVAEELLPTVSGCFFGSTQYDQWYIEDIKYTIELIEGVLNRTDFEKEIVMYSSSW